MTDRSALVTVRRCREAVYSARPNLTICPENALSAGLTKIAATKFLTELAELSMADAMLYLLVSGLNLDHCAITLGYTFAQVRWGSGRFVNQ